MDIFKASGRLAAIANGLGGEDVVPSGALDRDSLTRHEARSWTACVLKVLALSGCLRGVARRGSAGAGRKVVQSQREVVAA